MTFISLGKGVPECPFCRNLSNSVRFIKGLGPPELIDPEGIPSPRPSPPALSEMYNLYRCPECDTRVFALKEER